MFRPTCTRIFAVIAFTCALLSCSSSQKGDKTVVHGTVTLNGVAFADALVRFVPKDNPDLGTAQAKTDPNGNFTIQPDANNNNSLRPGLFIVLISKIVQTDRGGGMGTPTVNLAPSQYNLQAESPLARNLTEARISLLQSTLLMKRSEYCFLTA